MAREIATNRLVAISFMKPEKVVNLSAIVPINNYFQHMENIEKIIREAASLEIDLILVLDQESGQAFKNLTALLKKSKGRGLVIQSDSGNPGGARNAGLIFAKSDWVTFWDCDDEPLISEILEVISTSKSSEAQVLVGSYQIKSLKNKSLTTRILKERSWKIDLGLNPGIWRCIFRRDLVSKTLFPEARMGEDQVFLQRVFAKEPEVFLSQVVTYVYGTDVPNQLTGQRLNLKDLVYVNQIAVQELKPRSKYSKISRTMIIRQLLTLAQSENLGKLERLSYLAKAIVSLASNPRIFFRLIKMILEGFSK